jgi:hypothetical protein
MTKDEDKQRSTNDTQKGDRTIFCINFEERVTEDILYELFLQVENIDLNIMQYQKEKRPILRESKLIQI